MSIAMTPNPTLTTKSGNVAELVSTRAGLGMRKVDIRWREYPPSAADVAEVTTWFEASYQPKTARVKEHWFDPIEFKP